jgi:ABC-type sugar transport system ATPase subunit
MKSSSITDQDEARVILEGVSKYFGKTRALWKIDLDVKSGEFCVLLGPSGCGKSTLLRVIAGLEAPSEGRVFIRGRDVTDTPPGARDLAMVFQSYAIYPHMSVFDNIAFPLKVRRMPKEEIRTKVHEAAALLHLDGLLERKPYQLSGGQRQRVAMGRAIVRKPTAFLFDEPLSNLDARLRVSMRMEIADLHRKLGSTTIYVTHDQVEAMTLADRIVVLDDGVIQQIDSPQGLYNRPANVMVAQFIGAPSMNLIRGLLARHPSDGRAVFRSPSMEIDLPTSEIDGAVTLGVRPEHISVQSPGTCSGRVEFVEDTGADRYAHVRLDPEGKLLVRLPPELSVRTGDSLDLSFDRARVHIFPD